MDASIIRIARSVVVVTVATLVLVAPVAAKEPVDPNTLNPPPPAGFNATCERVGSGILCNLAFSDPPLANEPSAIFCDGTELLVSQTRSVVGKRFYDAGGNLERRHYREAYAGVLTDPTSGQTLDWIAHDTVDHVLGVPGDEATGRLTISGQAIRVSVPGGRSVLVDAGKLVIDVATDMLIHSGGPHHFDDYFLHGDVDALRPICDALA